MSSRAEAARPGRRSSFLRLLLAAPIIALATSCALFDRGEEEPPPASAAVPEPEGQQPLAYTVDLDGVEGDLSELLRDSSELISLQDHPPLTFARLERRIERDVETFGRALRSRGYYAHEIAYDIEQDRWPIEVEVTVRPGSVYRLAEYGIVYVDGPGEGALPRQLETLGIEIGSPAESAAIVNAQARLLRQLGEIGYPLAEVAERQAVIDHESREMRVTLRVEHGPRLGYGPVRITGLSEVKLDYVERLVDLPRGELYDQRRVEEARSRLSATGLFEGVSVEHAGAADERGALPVTVRLIERPKRTVGGGLSFSTDEGFGATAYWEHRNLLERNERLRITATVSEIEQGVSANFRKPHWRRVDQDLIADAGARRRDTDAFEEQSVSSSLGVARKVGDWNLVGAVSAEYSRVEERGERREFLLLGVPLAATLDRTDSALDPTEGWRVSLTLTPHVGSGDRDLLFVSGSAGGSAYFALDEAARYVLAGRGRIGSIVGAETLDLPASKRLYAGGGGSVRGYAFQKAGPLDDDGDPIGGRSLVEFGVEMRAKVTETIGIVPFLDGGTVFDRSFPDSLGDILWAAGLGARYYTDFGPVRLDVAFPLNRRREDDFFQFYVSLGQAF